eukprot:1335855-Amorphochlora_amoeboformis.AAC.1
MNKVNSPKGCSQICRLGVAPKHSQYPPDWCTGKEGLTVKLVRKAKIISDEKASGNSTGDIPGHTSEPRMWNIYNRKDHKISAAVGMDTARVEPNETEGRVDGERPPHGGPSSEDVVTWPGGADQEGRRSRASSWICLIGIIAFLLLYSVRRREGFDVLFDS